MSDASPESDAGAESAGKITRALTTSVLSRNLADLGTPGVWIEVDPDIAEDMGAFEEKAVSVADVEADEDGD